GVSLTNVFLFIGAWSTTKIPMMLFEMTQLGGKFSIIRFCLNLVGIIILAIIMEKTTSKKETDTIREIASSQIDG
ncbi:MAG: permease, partial [Emergencia sp.]